MHERARTDRAEIDLHRLRVEDEAEPVVWRRGEALGLVVGLRGRGRPPAEAVVGAAECWAPAGRDSERAPRTGV